MRCAVCDSKDHRDYNCPRPYCKFCLVVDRETPNCLKTEKAIQIESDTNSEDSEQYLRLKADSSDISIEWDRYDKRLQFSLFYSSERPKSYYQYACQYAWRAFIKGPRRLGTTSDLRERDLLELVDWHLFAASLPRSLLWGLSLAHDFHMTSYSTSCHSCMAVELYRQNPFSLSPTVNAIASIAELITKLYATVPVPFSLTNQSIQFISTESPSQACCPLVACFSRSPLLTLSAPHFIASHHLLTKVLQILGA